MTNAHTLLLLAFLRLLPLISLTTVHVRPKLQFPAPTHAKQRRRPTAAGSCLAASAAATPGLLLQIPFSL
jgi:hypothetical protein